MHIPLAASIIKVGETSNKTGERGRGTGGHVASIRSSSKSSARSAILKVSVTPLAWNTPTVSCGTWGAKDSELFCALLGTKKWH